MSTIGLPRAFHPSRWLIHSHVFTSVSCHRSPFHIVPGCSLCSRNASLHFLLEGSSQLCLPGFGGNLVFKLEPVLHFANGPRWVKESLFLLSRKTVAGLELATGRKSESGLGCIEQDFWNRHFHALCPGLSEDTLLP